MNVWESDLHDSALHELHFPMSEQNRKEKNEIKRGLVGFKNRNFRNERGKEGSKVKIHKIPEASGVVIKWKTLHGSFYR